MSDLKYKTVTELKNEKESLEKWISSLKQKLNNANMRLQWVEKYLFEKTPQEMTIEQIEFRLGHKVIIKIDPSEVDQDYKD